MDNTLIKRKILLHRSYKGQATVLDFGKEGIQELQEYQMGVLEGEVKVFSSQGRLKRVYHIKNNMKHGEEIEYFDYPILFKKLF